MSVTLASCEKEQEPVKYIELKYTHTIQSGSTAFTYYSVGKDYLVLCAASKKPEPSIAVSGDVISYIAKKGKGVVSVSANGETLFSIDLSKIEKEKLGTFVIP